MKKLRSMVLGATGLAGQQFVTALHAHPFIEITRVCASPRSVGKTYKQALSNDSGRAGWFASESMPESIAKMTIENAEAVSADDIDLVFSAVESDVAESLEPKFAKQIPVFSTASAFRYEDDVPLLIPPVNADHVSMVEMQQKKRGWKGYVLPIPNCTTTGLAMALAPLVKAFGVKSVLMTSLQAISGAGRSPGVPGLDVIDNVVPHIPKEEEKVEIETKKILGSISGSKVEPYPCRVSCTCTRVGVLDGHTETVFVSLAQKATLSEVAETWRLFRGAGGPKDWPSAPGQWIEVHDDPYRPQPRVDREAGAGMTTSIGRLREDGVLENGIKFVLVSHNTKMGAAKGAVLVAELLRARGKLPV